MSCWRGGSRCRRPAATEGVAPSGGCGRSAGAGAASCGAGGAEDAGHVREVEHGQEDADAFDDGRPELGVELEPVVAVPAFDGGDALGVLARRPAVVLDGGRDAEGREGVEEFPVEGGPDAFAARGLPFVVGEGVRVRPEVAGRDEDGGAGRRAGERVRLLDLLVDAVGVDGAVVEVAEGHPLVGERAVEFDQPADEVGVRLLPEGLLALAEELVEQRRDGVGERVAVQGGGKGVPLPAAAEGEFGVVVAPAGVFEHGADVVAEVALDFEHEGGGPLLRVRGLPRE